MITMKKLIAVLLLLLSFSGCRSRTDWVMFRGEEGQGRTSNAIFPPIAVKWKLQLQITNEPAIAFNSPIIMDNTIYFGSTDGNFYALDVESGYMKWVFKTNGRINSVPVGDKEKVYFGTNDGYVYAVFREDGELAWSFYTERQVRSSISLYKDMVVFTTDLGSTHFLTRDGKELYSIPNENWLAFTFQIYKGIMYFAPGPPEYRESFSIYDIENREYLDVIPTSYISATWYSPPAIDGDTVFFSTCDEIMDFDGELKWEMKYYGIHRITGEHLWVYTDYSDFGKKVVDSPYWFLREKCDHLDYMSPSLWNNLVIYTSGDAVVRAFQKNSFSYEGTLAWEKKFDYPSSSAPTVAGDRVYFGLMGDDFLPEEYPPKLVCLSAVNGNVLWELELDGAMLSAPVIAEKYIVFGTDRHYFYVLEEVF
jgi:outer membrane protein assembly factor BamB